MALISTPTNLEQGRIHCIACGSARGTRVRRKRMVKPPTDLSLYECSDCHVVYLDHWGAEFPAELYEYYQRDLGKPKAEIYDPITDRRYSVLLETFGKLVPGRRMLDIGCGVGQWVDYGRRHGWDASGIELADAALAICRQHDLPVTNTNLFSHALSPQTYDVVTLFEVIEHVPRPDAFLKRAAELVIPNGILCLSTPNFRSLDGMLIRNDWSVIHPEHLSYFTPKTISALARRTQLLEVIRLTAQNFSPGELLSMAKKRLGRPIVVGSTAGSPLRARIEESPTLRFAKMCTNALLNASRLGSAMMVWCRRLS